MEIVIRSAIAYCLILLLIRLTTRRVLRSATPLDFVIIFIFGGLFINGILGDDRSLTNSLLAAGTMSLMHVLISLAKQRWPLVGMITDGTPVLIYDKGKWNEIELHRLRIDKRDVIAELRQKGMRTLNDIDCAVVEHNGGITLIPAKK